MAEHVGYFLFRTTEFPLGEQGALGVGCEAITVGIGNAIYGAMFDKIVPHKSMLSSAQFAFGTSEVTLVAKHALHLTETNVVVIFIDEQVAEEQEEQ